MVYFFESKKKSRGVKEVEIVKAVEKLGKAELAKNNEYVSALIIPNEWLSNR